MQALVPYCGSAPLPAEIWARWNLDPVLLATLALLMLLSRRLVRADRRIPFAAGSIVVIVAFVSPLCALSSGLFSARSLHHLLLVAVAAPLLAHAGLRVRGVSLTAALLLHILLFWGWHLPAAYGAALSSHAVYWAMQVTMIGSAIVFWGALFDERSGITAIVSAAVQVLQMGLLGALLTFAPAALYAPHFATAGLYGLAPLHDQQLAGLLLWIASLPLTALALWPLLSRSRLHFGARMTPA